MLKSECVENISTCLIKSKIIQGVKQNVALTCITITPRARTWGELAAYTWGGLAIYKWQQLAAREWKDIIKKPTSRTWGGLEFKTWGELGGESNANNN